jgi:pimeloyl-ACP methyl ester carboxylesterase
MPIHDQIYYQLSNNSNGESAPVVLIHGAGGTHLHWPANIRRLAGHRVYAIDLPGHGKSEERGEQTIGAYAQRVLEWMASIDMYRAVFVGHSMGAAIALHIALAYPEHVIALGLLGGAARIRVAPIILENTASATTFPIALQAIMERAFSPLAEEQLVTLAGKRMQTTRPSVLHGDFLACNAFDIMDQLDQIRFPTLVLGGQDDQLTPVRQSQYLADQLPRASIAIIPQAGHMLMLEQPQAVAQVLLEFLSSLTYYTGHEVD